jgi:hypothetical protein
MRLSSVVFGVVCIVAIAIGSVPLFAQDQEDVRGAFLTSRPKEKPANAATATRPSRRRPKQTSTSNSNKSQTGNTSTNSGNTGTNSGSNTATKATPVNARRIGLGLSLFMRDSNGLAVRTDPSHVFHKGDRVRILLETNSDGYLYIFNTTNDGPATMIYPDPQLDEAGNYLQAHVPFEIPASTSEDERLRWLMFDDVSGNERLFFVFSREPLKGVPIEDDLITLCRDSSSSCPLKPAEDLWAQIQKDLKEPLKTDRSSRFGRAETASEQQATTRGLGLSKDDPPPSLIMMASSSNSTLVTSLDLVHK